MINNYHTHSIFSDGEGTLMDFVNYALSKGLSQLGFSDHAPVSFKNNWSMNRDQVDDYILETELLKQKFLQKIKILRSLEIDYIPGISLPFNELKKRFALDYTIGGVHLVKNVENEKLWFIDCPDEKESHLQFEQAFSCDIKKAVSAYYMQQIEMVVSEKPDIIAHCDKIRMYNNGGCFDDEEEWVQKLQDLLIKSVKATGVIVEINTRGLYRGKSDDFFPSERFIHRCIKQDVPFVISSDAHSPEEVDGYFSEAKLRLKDIGVKYIMSYNNGAFTSNALAF